MDMNVLVLDKVNRVSLRETRMTIKSRKIQASECEIQLLLMNTGGLRDENIYVTSVRTETKRREK